MKLRKESPKTIRDFHNNSNINSAIMGPEGEDPQERLDAGKERHSVKNEKRKIMWSAKLQTICTPLGFGISHSHNIGAKKKWERKRL